MNRDNDGARYHHVLAEFAVNSADWNELETSTVVPRMCVDELPAAYCEKMYEKVGSCWKRRGRSLSHNSYRNSVPDYHLQGWARKCKRTCEANGEETCWGMNIALEEPVELKTVPMMPIAPIKAAMGYMEKSGWQCHGQDPDNSYDGEEMDDGDGCFETLDGEAGDEYGYYSDDGTRPTWVAYNNTKGPQTIKDICLKWGNYYVVAAPQSVSISTSNDGETWTDGVAKWDTFHWRPLDTVRNSYDPRNGKEYYLGYSYTTYYEGPMDADSYDEYRPNQGGTIEKNCMVLDTPITTQYIKINMSPMPANSDYRYSHALAEFAVNSADWGEHKTSTVVPRMCVDKVRSKRCMKKMIGRPSLNNAESNDACFEMPGEEGEFDEEGGDAR